MTRCTIGWHVVELWKLSAEELLETQDVGVVPWVPLTEFHGPAEPIFQRCRAVIDERGDESERIDLLAVSQVLAGLRYNDPRLLDILGRKRIMIESPVLENFVNKRVMEARRQDILAFLEPTFGTVPEQLAAELGTVTDEQKLLELTRLAARCPDLEAIEAHLRGEGPASETPS